MSARPPESPTGADPTLVGGLVDVTPYAVTPMPGASPPVVPAPQHAASPTSVAVVCPACGTAARVDPERREATDFCRTCDYPLFWVQDTGYRPAGPESVGARRRLPGTVGAERIASVPCPVCNELNTVQAIVCLRCSAPMIPETPPAPEPLPVAPPPLEVTIRPVPPWLLPLLVSALGCLVLVVIGLAIGAR